MDVMKWLGIPEELRNTAILSLTHRSMRVTDNDIDGDKLKQYHDTGKNVYEALLVRFISRNFSLGINGIFAGMSASKSLHLVYNRLRLNELSVAAKGIGTDKIIDDLVYQFFGFLYEEVDFLFAYSIFIKAFTKEDIVFFSDYIGIINTITGGKGYQFTEIESGGPPHDPHYTYKLTLNGKETYATGSSKRAAKKTCAQKYCEDYLNQKDLFRILGYGKTVYRKRKAYPISTNDQAAIAKIAGRWGFAKEDIRNAMINKLLYNEFDFEDCSSDIMIGGVYERMLIRKTVHRVFNHYSFSVQKDIISEFENNDMLFKRIIEELELSNLFVMKEKLRTRLPVEVLNKEAVRQLMYSAFENENKLFFDMLEKVIVNLSKDMDPHLLNPSSKILAMYGQMKEAEPDVIFTQHNTQTDYHTKRTYYRAKIPVSFGETTITYLGEGGTQLSAKNNAYSKFWIYLYNCMNNVFRSNNPDEYTWFFTVMSNHIDWLDSYLKGNNHFVCESYKKNDFKKIIQYLHAFYSNVKHFDGGTLIPVLNTFWERKIAAIEINQKDVLLGAIWEYVVSHDSETYLTILESIDEVISLSDEKWKRLLRKNGKLIRHIRMPDEEIQLIAVQQYPPAINYIAVPSQGVIDYVYHHAPSARNESSSQGSGGLIELRPQIVDGLIEMKKEEIAQYKNKATESNQTIFLLDQHCFDLYLRAILGSYKVREFYIACGFVYASGIKMLRSEIDKLLADGMSVKILAGNLQHYFTDHPLTQMDLETAQALNQLIKAGAELKTITDCFYHGKMYVLVCEDITFVVVGSTNVSRNAFRFNDELDSLFVYGPCENQHTKHFEALWHNAVSIHELDESKFTSRIASNEIEHRHMLDIDSMRDRIKQIEDVELKNRLVTWLKYAPSNIYDKIDVGGNEYIAIEFFEKKMVVLESFYPGNAYFVFYNHPIDQLLDTIEGKSKTEVFKLSGMEKRGYHIREQLKLEVKIASYFV